MLLCPTTHILIQADLLTVPPGFERGMTFEPSVRGAPTSDLFPAPETVSISEVLFGGGEMAMEWGEGGEEEEEEEGGGGDITSKSALQQVRPLPVLASVFYHKSLRYVTLYFTYLIIVCAG